MRTLNQLDLDVAALQLRVNTLDGVGLSSQLVSTCQTLQTEVNGIRSTLNQSVLAIEAGLTNLQLQITSLSSRINSIVTG